MKLTRVHVKNFKCVRDSSDFGIDSKVTCLVGKNESGKTALLQALARINPLPVQQSTFDGLDYPRDLWSAYKERAATTPDDAITTTWALEPEDLASIQKVVGPGGVTGEITITKGYYDGLNWGITVDEVAVLRHLIATHDLRQEVRDELGSKTSVRQIREMLLASQPTDGEKKLLTYIQESFPQDSLLQGIIKVLQSHVPRMVYIPEYFRLPGQVSVDDLKRRIADPKQMDLPHSVFLAFLEMAGGSIQDLEGQIQFERLNAELEAVSNRISQEIFQYWSQNKHLRVNFRFDYCRPGDPPPFNAGYIVRTRIENTRHHVSVSFDERSTGFVWFFSFLVWFSQAKKNYGDRLVILLDEPGLSLHAKAQSDLLRYIEERLVPFQVIYTAHSPFMIDPKNLLRARTVEDVYIEAREGGPPPPESALGTKVGHRVFSTDRDTVFPLQAALGYEITQTLFIGQYSVLVEGPSEILYFEWFKRKLASLPGRTTLDKRWTITPCAGIDKIPAFLALFAGNNLQIAVFTDLATGQKKKVRDIRESNLLRDGHILTADRYADQEEADIEDVIGREAYIALVNECYQLAPDKRLPEMRSPGTPVRVVKEVEGALPADIVVFDHYRPAEFLTLQGIGFTLPGLKTALDRFECIFKDLNRLLADN